MTLYTYGYGSPGADPQKCHRAEIARRLRAMTGCEVRHLLA